MPDPLPLNGLDGSNPLGFLAALGTLALCERLDLQPRMAWVEYGNSYRPRLAVNETADNLADRIAETLREEVLNGPPAWCDADIIKRPRDDYRRFAEGSAKHPDWWHAAFAAAFASEACCDDSGVDVVPSKLSFANNQSGKVLLRDYRDLAGGVTTEYIDDALQRPWKNADACKSFRWEPRDLRLYALRSDDPGTSTVYTTYGANVLAFWAFTMLPSFPQLNGSLATAGFSRQNIPNGKSAEFFTWPIWKDPLSFDVVCALMLHPMLADERSDPAAAKAMGLGDLYRCQRVSYSKSLYFSQSVAI